MDQSLAARRGAAASRRGLPRARAQGPHPRARLQHLRRDLRLQGLGAGQGGAGSGRHRQPPYRHAVDGAGAPDRLRAVRGRAARPRLRPRSASCRAIPTRFRRGGGTGGSRSIPLGAPSVDRASRHARRADQGARRRRAGGRRRRHRAGRRHGARRRHRPQPLLRRHRDAREGQDQAHRDRRVQGGGADLPERHACLRGRDRPGDRAAPRSSATRSSTISARR